MSKRSERNGISDSNDQLDEQKCADSEAMQLLRSRTGSSLIECRNALRLAGGDVHLAQIGLRTPPEDPPEPEAEVLD